MTYTRLCKRCDGKGTTFHPGFTYGDKTYPDATKSCYSCGGAGVFQPLDIDAILAAIKGRKGLCSKRPADHRAYYVWRLARFHGGADVTMPIGATMEVRNDPFHPELDAIADAVAKRVFGTDLAAAHRWGRVLGHVSRDMPGLPETAYANGPVADSDKPEEESPELCPEEELDIDAEQTIESQIQAALGR